MAKIERIRQDVPGSFGPEELAQKTGQGWKLVAVEWEREVPEEQATVVEEVPFGLQVVANDPPHLEENPKEREVLFLMMELTIQDGPYSVIAEELNRRGYRTRQGMKWTPVSVFQMLPRLIEVGPRIFRHRGMATAKGAAGKVRLVDAVAKRFAPGLSPRAEALFAGIAIPLGTVRANTAPTQYVSFLSEIHGPIRRQAAVRDFLHVLVAIASGTDRRSARFHVSIISTSGACGQGLHVRLGCDWAWSGRLAAECSAAPSTAPMVVALVVIPHRRDAIR